MKKFLSILLAVVMAVVVAVPAFAASVSADDATLQFGADGKFKIMQLNDTQDVILTDVAQRAYVEKAIKQEQPDLLVFAGDQITDFFPLATKDSLKKCLTNFFSFLEGTGVPFVVTYGNHDHDWDEKGVLTLEEQMEIYKKYSNCIVPDNGYGLGTYNVPIKSSDGKRIAFNVYVMDSNNKAPEGLLTGYQGLYPEQVEWYKQTRDELQAANGGKVVKSLVFQHVPVKEIYQFLDEVPFYSDNLDDAVYSLDENKWYTLNDKVISGKIGEVPCSESLDSHTGEYQAWLEKGDVVGAFFAHDHVNNFVGVTDDGIMMGYNGGTGFSTYGIGGERSVRVFEIDENAPENFETHEVTFNELMGTELDFFIMDLFSPTLATTIAKFLLNLVPKFIIKIIAAVA